MVTRVKLVGGAKSESNALYAAAGALLAAGPVWHYLYVNFFPFSRIEAWALIVGTALGGAGVAILARRLGGIVCAVILAAMLYVFVDLQFDVHDKVRAPIIFAALLAVSMLLKERRALLTTLTLGAFYATALPRAAPKDGHLERRNGTNRVAPQNGSVGADTASGPRVLLHVILDEHWGVGGFRAEGDSATAAFLTDFYKQYGFALYPAAYSRYHRTVESIPQLMSLGAAPQMAPADSTKQASRAFRSVPYFQQLSQRGYALHVYQNSYLDFCAPTNQQVEVCETQSGNSIANIGYLEGSWTTRAHLAARYFLNITSHLYRRLHADPEVWRRATAGGGLQALRRLHDAIAKNPSDRRAYFVHVLLPHRPLETNPDCSALDDPTSRVGYEQPPSQTDAEWSHTLRLEGFQIRCTYRALARVFDALDSAVERENAMIVVHGDHGARVFQRRPDFVSLRPLDGRQLNGRFSTILAVRAPGLTPGVVQEPVPVQDYIWQFARQGLRGPMTPQFGNFVRGSRTDSIVNDTIRMLAIDEMPWARR